MTAIKQPLKISVVICTYNREKFIPTVLLCLASQTLSPEQFEIVVIDNNSTDDTAILVKTFLINHPQLNARYILETSKGLSFARNRGLEEAQAPVVTYLDDDAEPVPYFLETIVSFFDRHSTARGAGGKVIPKYSEGEEPAWMNKYLNGFVGYADHGPVEKKYTPSMKYPTGCNMTYTKETLQQAGGFNNELTFRSDDKHIFFEVSKLTDQIYYLPKAIVYHNIDNNRLSFGYFKKLFLKTGNEEKIRTRLEHGTAGMLSKLAEFSFKLAASLALYFFFLLKGREIKGRYIVYSQWYTWKGFLQKEVFVR